MIRLNALLGVLLTISSAGASGGFAVEFGKVQTATPPLFEAVLKDCLSCVKQLLKKGTNVNVRDEYRNTPLILAAYGAEENHIEIMKALLKAGAKVNLLNAGGYDAFSAALESRNTKGALFLMEQKIDFGKYHRDTGLQYLRGILGLAIEFRLEEIALRLIEKKIGLGYPVLAGSGVFESPEVFIRLLEAGRRIDERDPSRWSVLHFAALEGRTVVILEALQRGAHVDAEEKYSETPLMFAAAKGRTDAVRILLSAGAHREAKNYFGDTALDIALRNGHTDVADLLRAP